MKPRNFRDYLIITFKGIAMGAADVVPGVSGGTIAFISGIYDELLSTINSFNFQTLKLIKKEGIVATWKAVNGNFIIALLSGILISILSLAKMISWLLENEPIALWAFFFGLVLASVFYVGKEITIWKIKEISALILGSFFAYFLTTLQPLVTENSSLFFLFLSGSLAICAMILPGISGAFILVLLGAYKPVLEAVHTQNIKIIAVVGAGAVIGLLSFSRVLKWLFINYKNLTLAVLTGFLIGSLNKIWPWKTVLESKLIENKIVILREESVWPNNFNGDSQILVALVLAFIGFLVILMLEKIAVKYK